jgi:hypothetical protein
VYPSPWSQPASRPDQSSIISTRLPDEGNTLPPCTNGRSQRWSVTPTQVIGPPSGVTWSCTCGDTIAGTSASIR